MLENELPVSAPDSLERGSYFHSVQLNGVSSDGQQNVLMKFGSSLFVRSSFQLQHVQTN